MMHLIGFCPPTPSTTPQPHPLWIIAMLQLIHWPPICLQAKETGCWERETEEKGREAATERGKKEGKRGETKTETHREEAEGRGGADAAKNSSGRATASDCAEKAGISSPAVWAVWEGQGWLSVVYINIEGHKSVGDWRSCTLGEIELCSLIGRGEKPSETKLTASILKDSI